MSNRYDSSASQSWFLIIKWIAVLSLQGNLLHALTVAPRHCRGGVKLLHLSVGKDPSTQMTVSFASTWSNPGIQAPIAGVHIGTAPDQLHRFVGEQEFPDAHVTTMVNHDDHHYYSPYQHHVTIDNLEPSTTYFYVAVLGDRDSGIDSLREMPLRDHPSQHQNFEAQSLVMNSEKRMNDENEDGLAS